MNERNDAAPNMAVFCDYENVAIGVRESRYDNFNIDMVLERLLDKGKIVVKKAYADWERYKASKRPLHEAAFELIEIPHVSYSGKNSADIRMVVDALDLCYTKTHVDVFVIISGDSDFSPLVSKLRENNKTVIGLGVKNSSSDLLIDNCDEFIYYDDLVRSKIGAQRKAAAPGARGTGRGRGREPEKPLDRKPGVPGAPVALGTPGAVPVAGVITPTNGMSGAPEAPAQRRPDSELKNSEATGNKDEALELVLETVEALFQDTDSDLWGSMIKQTLKRKRPNFAESYYGYRSFNELLLDAEKQGLLEIKKDPKSGGYLILGFGPNA